MNYLYNGVELPALPKDERPFAIIKEYFGISGWFILEFADILPNGHTPAWNDNDGWIFLYDLDTTKVRYLYAPSSTGTTDWVPQGESDVLSDRELTSIVYRDGEVVTDWVWSNFDILLPNGDVCFAASYPINAETGEKMDIPLFTETAPIDPTSLLMGYRVGQMIRGMRNRPKEDV